MNPFLDLYYRCILAEANKVSLGAEKMAQKAEKMAQEAEKIAKRVADDTEEFVRGRFGPGFYNPHNHDGPAPTTTIYHHHHTTATPTITSTATITSTFVATSLTTVTHLCFPGPTAIAASAPRPTSNHAATTSLGEHFGYAATIRFWVLALLLFINAIIVAILVNPGHPKTKSSTRPKPRAPSLGGTVLDLTSLKPCITTRTRQTFAVVLCRIVIGLYLLESYWALDTILRIFWMNMGGAMEESNHWLAIFRFLLATINLVLPGGGIGFCFYLALDQQFTLDGELLMLEVPGDVSHCPTCKDKKTLRRNVHGMKGRVETDKPSIESGSDGDWEKAGFSN